MTSISPATPLQRVHFWCALGVFLATFSLFAYRASLVASFEFPVKYGEGILLDQSRRVFSEPGLYPPFDEPPFVIGNYPPVYPAVVALLPEFERAPFFAGRLVSLLSVLGCAFVIVLLVRRAAGLVAGFWSGAIFLSTPEIIEFGSLMRVDSLGLFLGLWGAYSFMVSCDASEARRRMRWRWVGSVAFFLSIYTRHSLLALPVGTFALLLWKEGRLFMRWPLGLLGAGILAFLVGSAWSGGELFTHLIYLNQLPFESDAIVRRWLVAMYPWRYPLVLAAALACWPGFGITDRLKMSRILFTLLAGLIVFNFSSLVVAQLQSETGQLRLFEQVQKQIGTTPGGRPQFTLERQYVPDVLRPFLLIHIVWGLIVVFSLLGWSGNRERDRPARASALLLLLGAATALMSGRAGADVNYTFEYLTISIVVAGAAVGRLVKPGESARPRFFRPAFFGWGLLVLSIVFVTGNQWMYSKIGGIRPERLQQISQRSALIERLLELGGPVLSEDPSIPVLMGEPLYYQPFMYRQLADANIWDPKVLADQVSRREFKAIVVELHRPYNLEASKIDGARFVPVFANRTGTLRSFPKAVEQAILEHYTLDSILDEFVTARFMESRAILVPRP